MSACYMTVDPVWVHSDPCGRSFNWTGGKTIFLKKFTSISVLNARGVLRDGFILVRTALDVIHRVQLLCFLFSWLGLQQCSSYMYPF